MQEELPYPEPRLKWLASMLQDLLLYDDRWSTAELTQTTPDPLVRLFTIRCRRPVPDPTWKVLKDVIRRWAYQNDCVAKRIRRYKNRVEVVLLIKYLNRESDFSPYEELPGWEKRWREMNATS